jgi:hypothetical protein
MKKNYAKEQEKIINKIFESNINGVVNVNQIAKRSYFSRKWIIDACEYLVTRGVLHANRIGAEVTISYTIVKKFF